MESILPHKREQMVCPEYVHKVQGDLCFSVVENDIVVGLSMTSSCQWKDVEGPKYAWMESRIARFKLRNNIYIIGLYENRARLLVSRIHQGEDSFREFLNNYVSTWHCDRYDIVKDEFCASEHEIPSFISDVYDAETALNESYAFILTNVGLIPFSSENGFEYDERPPYYPTVIPYNPISQE